MCVRVCVPSSLLLPLLVPSFVIKVEINRKLKDTCMIVCGAMLTAQDDASPEATNSTDVVE